MNSMKIQKVLLINKIYIYILVQVFILLLRPDFWILYIINLTRFPVCHAYLY